MPVASIATEVTPCALSQSRNSRNCPVVVPKTFGGPPATETCNCSLPTSIAAAVGSSTGKVGVVIHFSQFGSYRFAHPWHRARPGSEKNKPFQRESHMRDHQSIHLSLAGTNLPNERPEIGRVIVLNGHAARRHGRRTGVYQVHGPNACFKKRKEALQEPAFPPVQTFVA